MILKMLTVLLYTKLIFILDNWLKQFSNEDFVKNKGSILLGTLETGRSLNGLPHEIEIG